MEANKDLDKDLPADVGEFSSSSETLPTLSSTCVNTGCKGKVSRKFHWDRHTVCIDCRLVHDLNCSVECCSECSGWNLNMRKSYANHIRQNALKREAKRKRKEARSKSKDIDLSEVSLSSISNTSDKNSNEPLDVKISQAFGVPLEDVRPADNDSALLIFLTNLI